MLFGRGFDLPHLAASFVGVIVAITIHEFAHAWAAYLAGDDTAKKMGRMSLNPYDHFDLIGTLMLLFAGFGWAKPVPVNPYRFRKPRRDSIIVSLAGPVSNLLIVTLVGLSIRFNIINPDSLGIIAITVIRAIILMNLGLGFFNLIPIPPLDGSKVLSELLSGDQARAYDRTMSQWGFIILIILLLTGAIGYIIGPPMILFWRVVSGNIF